MVEGVRKFRQAKRLTFGKGFNFIYGPSESGKSTLFECLIHLIFPISSPYTNFAPWGTINNSRAGLFLKRGKSGVRVIKDFQNGVVKLSKIDENGNAGTIADEPDKTEQMLTNGFGISSYRQFCEFYTLRQEDMPSSLSRPCAPVAAPSPAEDPNQVPMPAPPDPNAYGNAPQPPIPDPGYGSDPMGMSGPVPMPSYGAPPSKYSRLSKEEKLKKIEELKAELGKAQEADDVQFKLDDMERQIFELGNKTKSIQEIESRLKRLENEIESNKALDEVEPEMVSRIKSFEQLEAKHNEEAARLDDARNESEIEYMEISQRNPFYMEPFFMGGSAAVVAGIISQIVLASRFGFIRFINVLMILGGMGLAGWMIWNEFSRQGKEQSLKKKFDEAEAKRQDAINRFEIEGVVVNRLMSDIGVSNPKELAERLEKYFMLKKQRTGLQDEITSTKADINYDSLQDQIKKIEDEKTGLEGKLRELGTGAPIVSDLQSELDELEQSLDEQQPQPQGAPPRQELSPMPGAMPPPPGTPGGYDMVGGPPMDQGLQQMPPPQANPEGTFIMPQKPPETSVNPIEEILLLAEEVISIDRRSLISQVKPRFDTFLKAFTSNIYVEGDFTDEGELSLRTGEMSHYSEFDSLSPSGKDSVYLALRIALMEAAVKKKPFPIILDDPFHYLDDARSFYVSKALKKLAEGTQVLLFSSQRIHSKAADVSLSIVEPPA